MRPAPEHVVVTNGRVRAGYRIGEMLFGELAPATPAADRPRHRRAARETATTRSRPTSPGCPARVWATPGVVDHNHTKVISNIADTALDPVLAARQTVALLG